MSLRFAWPNRAVFCAACLIASPLCSAEYVATGDFKGTVCRGIGIELCSPYKIDAVRGNDGQLYTLKNRFESVTEYNEHKKRCHIRTKMKNGGAISWSVNAAIQPVFYTRESSGEYTELDVDYVSFPCFKR